MPIWRKKPSGVKRGIPDDPEEFRLTLVEHLEELRDRIIRSFVVVMVCWVIGWYIEPLLYDRLNHLVEGGVMASIPKDTRYTEAFQNVTEPFMLKFRLSFMIAIGLAFPFLLMQLWGFIAPGLRATERKPLQKLAPLSIVLFAVGVGFGFLVIQPTFKFFASYLEDFPRTVLNQQPGSMVFFVLKMLMAFGVGFQLPLVVYFLGRIGLLEPETMMKYWRQATVVIFVVSAALTPSNDVFSMLMMAIPLSILFMISVWAIKITTRRGNNPVAELNALD